MPVSPTSDLDVAERARLTWRRSELESEARAAAAQPKELTGNLLVVVPDDNTSRIQTILGRLINVEVVDGKRVARLFPAEFRDLIMGGRNSLDWQKANEPLLGQI
ncbi:hypothetical protein C7U65_31400 [Bradyrhizobium sp. WBAH23]|nr:hypothetical protein [Bradyrhizobium sp. WBAH30]MDD1546188.1 hypothetical protein [Bradyrhizobium sp. WBAH41]MDD1560068.1 hypothetical protein [Bradyrhizobium sp. WBAH23]MDD1593478.1 hypothetical protein [Bradyrhizobium sp. WBAH42]NRB90679.1 hypothetical protein [Bradyrhizobium sp. WBAH10]